VRVLCEGQVVLQDNSAINREGAARALKECLRMVDKCGYGSRMAAASRDRFFCGGKRPSGD
jgi:ribosomal protein S27AE